MRCLTIKVLNETIMLQKKLNDCFISSAEPRTFPFSLFYYSFFINEYYDYNAFSTLLTAPLNNYCVAIS